MKRLTIAPRDTPVSPPLAGSAWALQTFGGVDLGDQRRVTRLVRRAAALATDPAPSLGQALVDPAALKATYRLLHSPAVTAETITAEHREQTLRAARSAGTVLLVQDTTEFDYSHHPATELAPLGPGREQGYLLQSVLAIRPPVADAPGAVLGLATLDPFLRTPAPPGETRTDRSQRPRESDAWLRSVETIGAPPSGTRWVHVGDRGADALRFYQTVQAQGAELLVRVAQNRRVQTAAGETGHLLSQARALPAGTERRAVVVPTRGNVRGRTATVAVGWAATVAQPSWLRAERRAGSAPIAGWVVRVWEPDPPTDGTPLEWVLFTTVPTSTEADAWERVGWYQQRWVVEEYHQALKTGCRLEASQLRDQDALWALLGLCAPIAVRLLQLRGAARSTPNVPADAVFSPTTVQVVAALTRQEPAPMTVRTCWRLIARLGGHQGRTGDGEPGWQTIWAGWHRVQQVETGVRLAASLPPPV